MSQADLINTLARRNPVGSDSESEYKRARNINSLTEVSSFLKDLSSSTKRSPRRSLVLTCLAYKEGLEGDLFYLDVIKYARMDFKRRLKEGAVEYGHLVQRMINWIQSDEEKIVKLNGEVRQLRESKVQQQDETSLNRAEYDRVRSQLEATEEEREKFRLLSEGRANYIKKLLPAKKQMVVEDHTVKGETAVETAQVKTNADERIQALENLITLKDTAIAALQKTADEAVQKGEDAQNALAHHHEIAQSLNSAMERKDQEIERAKEDVEHKDMELVELRNTMAAREAARAERVAALEKDSREPLQTEKAESMEMKDRESKKLKDRVATKDKELKKLKDRIEQGKKALEKARSQVTLKDQKVEELKTKIEGQSVQINQLTEMMDNKDQEAISLEESVASKAEELEELKDTIGLKDADITWWKLYADDKERELVKLRKAQKSQPTETTSTNAVLEAKDSEIRVLKENAASKIDELEELRKALEAQAAEARVTKALVEVKDRKIRALEHEVASKIEEIQELQQTITQKASETEMLWDRVYHLQGESKKRKRSD